MEEGGLSWDNGADLCDGSAGLCLAGGSLRGLLCGGCCTRNLHAVMHLGFEKCMQK